MIPFWLKTAHKYLGLKEIHGPTHNPQILEWWKKIKMPFNDDETPWCAGYVGGVLEESGIVSTRSASARSYLSWGKSIPGPAVGCVVVFWRGNPNGPYGHVGFVCGKDEFGHIMVIGGNQGDMVNIKAFAIDRVLSYRWPVNEPSPATGWGILPVIKSSGEVSTNEA